MRTESRETAGSKIKEDDERIEKVYVFVHVKAHRTWLTYEYAQASELT